MTVCDVFAAGEVTGSLASIGQWAVSMMAASVVVNGWQDRRVHSMLSRLQIIEPPRPNGDSDESQGGVSDGSGHSTNLPIAPLADT